MITNKDEYQLRNGQYISIQFNGNCWEVGCWDKDDSNHWYKEFTNEKAAKEEFKRWRE